MSKAETITSDDAVFHKQVVEDIKLAQQAEQQILSLQQQITAANGVMRSWSRHLAKKYELGPNDGIDEAGVIRRQ